MTAEQRSMYELGQTTVRSSVWKEMGKLGIQDNPIAKGRYLISQYGGRMGILIHASNPLNLIKTVGTGGTPMATHVGSFVANAARAGGSAYFTHLSSQFN
jgi:hypothetical protein